MPCFLAVRLASRLRLLLRVGGGAPFRASANRLTIIVLGADSLCVILPLCIVLISSRAPFSLNGHHVFLTTSHFFRDI